MVLKLHWAQKRMFWAFEKGICQFFTNFWVTKLKLVKIRNKLEPLRPFKFKVGQMKVFRKWFWNNLVIKNECSVHLEREIFSFLQFLIYEVEAIFWESEAKFSKLSKSKFGHMKLLKNGFEATSSSKANVLSVWKGHFSVICKFLSDERIWNHFLGKQDNAAKTFCTKSALFGAF